MRVGGRPLAARKLKVAQLAAVAGGIAWPVSAWARGAIVRLGRCVPLACVLVSTSAVTPKSAEPEAAETSGVGAKLSGENRVPDGNARLEALSKDRCSIADEVKAAIEKMARRTRYQDNITFNCDQVMEYKFANSDKFTVIRIENSSVCKEEICLTVLFDTQERRIILAFDAKKEAHDLQHGFLVTRSLERIAHHTWKGSHRNLIFYNEKGKLMLEIYQDVPLVRSE